MSMRGKGSCRLLPLALATAIAMRSAEPTGSISGFVLDAESKAPLAKIRVSVSSGSGQVSATTDVTGSYKLEGLPPGQHRVSAEAPARTFQGISASAAWIDAASKLVRLGSGQDLTGINLHIRGRAFISGRVLDENGDGVPRVDVCLVLRQYQAGALRYFTSVCDTTDSQGKYRLGGLQARRAHLLLAAARTGRFGSASDVPADPELRKPVPQPTFFPSTTSIDGAEAVILRGGEEREGVDIRIARSPAFCLDGVLESEGAPASLLFGLGDDRWDFASSGSYRAEDGKTGPDGKFRVCDLPPGSYRLVAQSANSPKSGGLYGAVGVEITDRDVHGIRVAAAPGQTLPGRVAWHEQQADRAAPAPELSILLRRLRYPLGSWSASSKSARTGEFAVADVSPGDYVVVVSGLSGSLHLKEISYAGASVMNAPLRLGEVIGGSELRVTVARDGGFLRTKVVDDDGDPISETNVYIFPVDAASEAVLAGTMVAGKTDLDGLYSSPALPPGKYFVIASESSADASPESIAKLWRSRTRAKEVEVGPGAIVQLTLKPASID